MDTSKANVPTSGTDKVPRVTIEFKDSGPPTYKFENCESLPARRFEESLERAGFELHRHRQNLVVKERMQERQDSLNQGSALDEQRTKGHQAKLDAEALKDEKRTEANNASIN